MLRSEPVAKEFCAYTALHRSTQAPEVSVDFVLPDYYGDIRRILQVSATPRLDGVFREETHLEYDGTVTFSILYLTEEDHLRNLTFSESFSGECEISQMNAESLVSVLPVAESVTCRVQGPRKLTARCKLQVSITARHHTCLTPGFDGHYRAEDEATVSYDRSEITTMRMLELEEKDLSLTEELTLDSTLPAISEIIRSDITLHILECHPTADELACRGEAILSVLYRGEGASATEHYACFTKKLPFATALTSDELTDRFTCRCIATPATWRVMPQTNSYGEMRTISLSLTWDLLAICCINDTRAITRDLFSTKYPCAGEMIRLPVTQLVSCQRTSCSVTEAKPRTELGAEAASAVLQVLGEVKQESLSYDKARGRICFTGKASACVLMQNGENGGISDTTLTLPVRCELPCLPIEGGEELDCTCRLIGAEGRLDTNNLILSLEVAVEVGCFATQEVSLVESIHLDTAHPLDEKRPAMLLYYPTRGEQLWEIAKRFHVTPDALLGANRLGAQDAVDTQVLLIPRILR